MSGPRQNFYVAADGTTKKYTYCACSAGPFKEEDIFNPKTGEGSCIVLGLHITYCLNCAKLHGIAFRNNDDDNQLKKVRGSKLTEGLMRGNVKNKKSFRSPVKPPSGPKR